MTIARISTVLLLCITHCHADVTVPANEIPVTSTDRAVDAFRDRYGRLPTAEEGLEVLVTEPDNWSIVTGRIKIPTSWANQNP